MSEVRKYQPSNGTEGEAFMEDHCWQCRHCDPDPCGPKQCELLLLTLTHQITEPEYPEEWQYTADAKPTCTKYSHWDWDEMGNPDDPENPNYIIPVAPNQIKLFEE